MEQPTRSVSTACSPHIAGTCGGSFPVCFERLDLPQRVSEVTAEAHGAIVDEDVRRRLAPRHLVHQILQPMHPQPSPHARRMSCGEDDDVEAPCLQLFEKRACAGTWRIPVVGMFPPGVVVQHAVQIDADQRPFGIVEVEPRHLK